MVSFTIGYILCLLLLIISVIAGLAGGGYILAVNFCIPIWIGSIIFGITYAALLVLAFILMFNDSDKDKGR